MSARAQNLDKIISAVQARECLWEKGYRGQRNKFTLERYWDEVAAEVGTTSQDCRKRWKNLKDHCRKEMKKFPNGSDWPHFQKLGFIHKQLLNEDDEGSDTNEEVFNSIDDSVKTQKLEYTMRMKLLIKKRSLDVDMIKLIDLVRAREIIWNQQLKGHHNWKKLDESWKEIALELGVTHDQVRSKWKYLRGQARKEVRKQGSQWEFLPQLQFLKDQLNDYEGNELQEDQFSQDYDADQSSSLDPTPIDQVQEEPEYLVQQDEFETKPTITETDFYDDDLMVRLMAMAQRNVTYGNNGDGVTQDEDLAFFYSLLPHIKKLKPAKKLILRMNIEELVFNTVYQS